MRTFGSSFWAMASLHISTSSGRSSQFSDVERSTFSPPTFCALSLTAALILGMMSDTLDQPRPDMPISVGFLLCMFIIFFSRDKSSRDLFVGGSADLPSRGKPHVPFWVCRVGFRHPVVKQAASGSAFGTHKRWYRIILVRVKL